MSSSFYINTVNILDIFFFVLFAVNERQWHGKWIQDFQFVETQNLLIVQLKDFKLHNSEYECLKLWNKYDSLSPLSFGVKSEDTSFICLIKNLWYSYKFLKLM